MSQKETTLTSVKIFKNLYNDYKYMTVNNTMSFQKLVNRSVYLYLNDDEFKQKINETKDLKVSGSKY
jgi:hypothetical protein|tara:strand:+ start:534 stop:734 length:201 start_codon:yes stop_codon:yes gene_type:complete